MTKFTALYGCPASGKTTYANSTCSVRVVSADAVRFDLYGSQDKYGNGNEVWAEIVKRIRYHLLKGENVIYDACNLKRSYRLDILKELSDIDCWKTLLRINTPYKVCEKWHNNRVRDISWSKLKPYFDIKEYPDMSEGWDEIHDKSFMPWAKRFYLASPFFETDARANALEVSEMLRGKGFEVFVPMEKKVPNAWGLSNSDWGKAVFDNDMAELRACNAVICLSYGRISSAGTNFEAGYAYGIGKPVIVVEMPGVKLMSLMLSNGSHAVLNDIESLKHYNFNTMPKIMDYFMEQK